MAKVKHVTSPPNGVKIQVEGDKLIVGDHPIIPFIEGDGIGPEIWKASRLVLDSAVKLAYSGKKRIEWMEVYAGNKAAEIYGNRRRLPGETVTAIKEYSVAINGPLASLREGSGIDLNYQLRHALDLFACIRPVKYFNGLPGNLKNSKKIDIVIISENLEDISEGFEYKAGSKSGKEIINYFNSLNKTSLGYDTSIGIKRISEFGTMRLIKKAIEFAIDNKRESVTITHKSNLTEDSFRNWAYKAAKMFLPDQTITEQELIAKYNGKKPKGMILMKDRLTDKVLQDILLNPEELDVVVAPGVTGNFLATASSTHVGGLGVIPLANLSYSIGLFGPIHRTVEEFEGKDIANPTGMIQAGVMMLEYISWNKAAKLITIALKRSLKSKTVTKDLSRFINGAKSVKCSRFAQEIVRNMN